MIRASERFLAEHTVDGYCSGAAANTELATVRELAEDEDDDDGAAGPGKSSLKQNGKLTNGHTNGHANGFAVSTSPAKFQSAFPCMARQC